MENISNALFNLTTIIVLGAIGLTMLIAAIVGIPYIIGRILFHYAAPSIAVTDERYNPWPVGMVALIIMITMWVVGTSIKIMLAQ